jgi:hypothetical protein
MTNRNTYLICPNADDCAVYKNWAEKGSPRQNVIVQCGGEYDCLALMASRDEDGVSFSEDFKERIEDNGVKEGEGLRETGCFNLTLLNKLAKL